MSKAIPCGRQAESPSHPRELAGPDPAAERLPVGVYAHFPWCQSKCLYCDFTSFASTDVPNHEFTEAILSELEARASKLGQRRKLGSVYIGGGTPSLWKPASLARVLGRIVELFGVREGVETTLECNPTGLTQRTLEQLLGAGVTRLSLGVQSLDPERLRWLGRQHGPDEASSAVARAVSAGFSHVSADLLFGLPGQPVAEVVGHARQLVDLGIDHLSAYELTFHPSTPLGRWAMSHATSLAPDAVVARTYAALERAMAHAGFEHYEISNYARPGCRSIHNLGYWLGRDYIGLGPGACGTVTLQQTVRYRNTPSWDAYRLTDWTVANLDFSGPGQPQIEREVLDVTCRLRERLMLGLRLDRGVDVSEVAAELGVDAWTPEWNASVRQLTSQGALELTGSRLRIPRRRWLVADAIIAQLV